MDGMEIINLHKRCNKKARKTSQPKKAPKSDEETKKASRSSDGKNAAIKAGKKFKRPHSLKKHQSHLNLLTQARKKRSRPRMIKRKKYLLC